MSWKRNVIVLAALALSSAPAWAGSFGIYAARWNSSDADQSWGGGARVGFNFVKSLELEFHGTYYRDFRAELPTATLDVKAIPVDGGLKFNFLPGLALSPYVGLGVSRFFLGTNTGGIDDKNGWYGEAGLDFGGKNSRLFVEGMWRKVDTTISLNAFDENVKFDGIDWHAGAVWRWGR